MPTYEYECTACGHTFDIVQSMKDPHLTDCPKAGCAGPVRRKIGRGAGIIFKGSGFYQTDYRSDAYKAAAKKDSGGGDGGGAATTTTTAAGAGAGSAGAATPAPAPAPATPSTSSSSTGSSGKAA